MIWPYSMPLDVTVDSNLAVSSATSFIDHCFSTLSTVDQFLVN